VADWGNGNRFGFEYVVVIQVQRDVELTNQNQVLRSFHMSDQDAIGIGTQVDGIQRERCDLAITDSVEFLYTFAHPLRVRTAEKSINAQKLVVVYNADERNAKVREPEGFDLICYTDVRKNILDDLEKMIRFRYVKQNSPLLCDTQHEGDRYISRLSILKEISFRGFAYDYLEVETLESEVLKGTKLSGILGDEITTLFEERLIVNINQDHTYALGCLTRIYGSLTKTGVNHSREVNYCHFSEAEGSVWLV